jgi:hypothetical protein
MLGEEFETIAIVWQMAGSGHHASIELMPGGHAAEKHRWRGRETTIGNACSLGSQTRFKGTPANVHAHCLRHTCEIW